MLDRRDVEHARDAVAHERHRAGDGLGFHVGDEGGDVRSDDRLVLEQPRRPLALTGIVVGGGDHAAVVGHPGEHRTGHRHACASRTPRSTRSPTTRSTLVRPVQAPARSAAGSISLWDIGGAWGTMT